MFKSSEQPLCRWCAKPIRKETVSVYVKREQSQYDRPMAAIRYVYTAQPITTKAECQKLTNQQICSVSRSYQKDENFELTGNSEIDRFTEWDGESYADEFFCSGGCAQRMGYSACAAHGMGTKRFHDAIKDRRRRQAKENSAEAA